MKKPTGDPSCPEDVRRAKRAAADIEKSFSASVWDDRNQVPSHSPPPSAFESAAASFEDQDELERIEEEQLDAHIQNFPLTQFNRSELPSEFVCGHICSIIKGY